MRLIGINAITLTKIRYSTISAAEQIDFSKIIQDTTRETETPQVWIANKKKELESTKQCLYSASKKPFPHNPNFIYHTPLDDFTRNQIYYLFKNHPNEWTIRKLAKKFQISLSRVDAIIDLKEHEDNLLKHGFKRNEHYISSMEAIVGANGQQAREVVKEVCDVWKKRAPMFIRIPEDKNLSFKEAARLLGLTDKFYHFDPDKDEKVTSESIKVIQVDPEETSRKWIFFIVDISKDKHPTERKILIREPDGTLREALPEEKIRESYRIWGSDCINQIELPKIRLLRRLVCKQLPKVP